MDISEEQTWLVHYSSHSHDMNNRHNQVYTRVQWGSEYRTSQKVWYSNVSGIQMVSIQILTVVYYSEPGRVICQSLQSCDFFPLRGKRPRWSQIQFNWEMYIEGCEQFHRGVKRKTYVKKLNLPFP